MKHLSTSVCRCCTKGLAPEHLHLHFVGHESVPWPLSHDSPRPEDTITVEDKPRQGLGAVRLIC